MSNTTNKLNASENSGGGPSIVLDQNLDIASIGSSTTGAAKCDGAGKKSRAVRKIFTVGIDGNIKGHFAVPTNAGTSANSGGFNQAIAPSPGSSYNHHPLSAAHHHPASRLVAANRGAPSPVDSSGNFDYVLRGNQLVRIQRSPHNGPAKAAGLSNSISSLFLSDSNHSPVKHHFLGPHRNTNNDDLRCGIRLHSPSPMESGLNFGNVLVQPPQHPAVSDLKRNAVVQQQSIQKQANLQPVGEQQQQVNQSSIRLVSRHPTVDNSPTSSGRLEPQPVLSGTNYVMGQPLMQSATLLPAGYSRLVPASGVHTDTTPAIHGRRNSGSVSASFSPNNALRHPHVSSSQLTSVSGPGPPSSLATIPAQSPSGAAAGRPPGSTAKGASLAAKNKKPCSCTRSMCLKLYCDCFANGEFCRNCHCINCHNSQGYDQERGRAIKSVLERNPNAFHPKVGKIADSERKHFKGCQCKKSACLKNYCECYEAKVTCSARCKCSGCRNDDMKRHAIRHTPRSLRYLANVADAHEHLKRARHRHDALSTDDDSGSEDTLADNPWSVLRDEAVEAISRCLLTKAHSLETQGTTDPMLTEGAIVQEFGRCLHLLMTSLDSQQAAAKRLRLTAPPESATTTTDDVPPIAPLPVTDVKLENNS